MKILLVALTAILGALLLGTVIASITSIFVWLLWNALVPAIFGLAKITFLQAFGLSILCNILFKSTTTVNQKSE